ncbi:MAG TPA: primosomal protein N' [Chitinophagales bacterium]|nr:primosomal protein N' [Chitinophagales bacterium]
MLYCEVILPLYVKGTFTYKIPEELESFVVPGIRVEVSFGRRKLYTAIVKTVHQNQPTAYQAKEILGVVDNFPIVNQVQLKFWEWMATYYCCYEGEVMLAALPSYFRPDSETKYLKSPYCEIDILDLPDDEYMVASAMESQDFLTLLEIQQILQKKSVQNVIKSLINKKVILIQEFLEEKFKPKLEPFIQLNPIHFQPQESLRALFKKLEKKTKQTDLLLGYLSLAPKNQWIPRNELLKHAEISAAVLRTAIQNEIFLLEEREVSRIEEEDLLDKELLLNEEQQQAFAKINEQWKEQQVVLLRGVTASGKTHVYVDLIKQAISQGKQVLYLVPEIALTTQLIRRLKVLLGTVGVYHSKYNPSERVETWLKVLNQEINIVIGARSAMFLPFTNLGLIIVDEEHDGSYKQNDPAPRYQARDCVIWLAYQTQAKVLLGSATPSMESWANAHAGKYGWVELLQRHGNMSMPEIEFINMTQARKTKQVTGVLSDQLQASILKTLHQKSQVIIFLNRRGYSPYIACKDCAWIPYCQHCDVSLTFHKFSEQLKCHYCGYTTPLPRECPSCHSIVLEMKGSGTERVEDDLQAIFQDAKFLRLDYDTAKSKHAHEKIIHQFENDEADILIGTQMVTKGLDFKNVHLVGVLSADSLLYYPDFRATERAFQLLSQVSGRAGRSEKTGKVLIQISNPDHPITNYLRDNNIENFYKKELGERKKFHYPPFVRMIHISVRDASEKVANDAAKYLFLQINAQIEGECLGPSIPSLSKLQGKYIREIIIKLDRKASVITAAKNIIENTRQLMYQYKAYKKVRLVIDVDP